MTDPAYTHYVIIVDRSGSMRKIAADTEGGIRAYAHEQDALPGRKTLSLYQFDDKHDRLVSFGPLADAAGYELRPRGWTRLNDAAGHAISEVGDRLAEMPEDERPGKVIVMIATDGQENDSREYSTEALREMITLQQEKYGWQFTYIGANQDAFAEAAKIGIPAAAAMDYAASPGGTQSAWSGASASSARYVRGQDASLEYSDTERRAAAGEGS
jgi:Mg-chelatase subunit ChlD